MERDSFAPGSLRFPFPQYGVTVTVSRLKDKSDGLTAEVAITGPLQSGPDKLITKQLLNLSSGITRERLAKRLYALSEGPEWNTIIEQVCVQTLADLRKGEAAQELTGETEYEGETFILNPLLYHQHPTLLYGPGDTGKSFLALYLALLLAKGGSENGVACCDQSVLYLDWELSGSALDQRVSQLIRGHPDLAPATLRYRRLTRPLQDCLEEVGQTIAETEATVLILDSVGLAAGGELERAETAITFFQALRHLNRTALLIGHTAKAQEEDKRTPFGSVYFFNLARSIWEVKKAQHDGTATIGLYHRKNNLGPRHTPLGFDLTFHGPACTVSVGDLTAEAHLERALPIPERIAALLGDHRARSSQQIALDLGEKEVSVRGVLSRYKGRKWHKIGEDWTVL